MSSATPSTPSRHVYILGIADNASDLYSWGIPSFTDTPAAVYSSPAAATLAAAALAENFDTFLPVQYGTTYPYEAITFEEVLQTKGAAPFGWGIVEDTRGKKGRIGIQIIRLALEE